MGWGMKNHIEDIVLMQRIHTGVTNPTSNTVNLSRHVRNTNFACIRRLQTFEIFSDTFVLQKPVSTGALITSDRQTLHWCRENRGQINNFGLQSSQATGTETRKIRIRHDIGAKLEIPGKLRKKCEKVEWKNTPNGMREASHSHYSLHFCLSAHIRFTGNMWKRVMTCRPAYDVPCFAHDTGKGSGTATESHQKITMDKCFRTVRCSDCIPAGFTTVGLL